MAVGPCIITSSAFSLGVYFSYVPCLVDFVANSDVESLVLPALQPHICWLPRYRRMAFATREAR